jgi:predicted urease superfamily metal-dependent hydrolase
VIVLTLVVVYLHYPIGREPTGSEGGGEQISQTQPALTFHNKGGGGVITQANTSFHLSSHPEDSEKFKFKFKIKIKIQIQITLKIKLKL